MDKAIAHDKLGDEADFQSEVKRAHTVIEYVLNKIREEFSRSGKIDERALRFLKRVR